MKHLEITASKLREIADGLVRQSHPIVLPMERYTQQQAFEAIRNANGGQYCSIGVETVYPSSTSPHVNWRVYTSEPVPTSFEAATMTLAVDQCLAWLNAKKQTAGETLTEIETTLNESREGRAVGVEVAHVG